MEGGDTLPGPSKLIEEAGLLPEGILSQEQKAKQLGAEQFKLLSWPGRDLMKQYVKKVWGKECGGP